MLYLGIALGGFIVLWGLIGNANTKGVELLLGILFLIGIMIIWPITIAYYLYQDFKVKLTPYERGVLDLDEDEKITLDNFEDVVLIGWWDKLSDLEQSKLCDKYFPQFSYSAIDGPEIMEMYKKEHENN
jgi:hypothetical protein